MAEMYKCSGFLTFDELLVEVVDDVLKSIFKNVGAFHVWSYLEMTALGERTEIAWKPEAFSVGLRRLLGSAAPDLEKLILTRLYQKLRLRLEWKKGYKFSDYINRLRKASMEIELARRRIKLE